MFKKSISAIFCIIAAVIFAEELPPVSVVSIKTVPVTIPEIKLPRIVIPKIIIPEISLLAIEIPEFVLADCGISSPKSDYISQPMTADCGIKTPCSTDELFQYVINCGISSPKSDYTSQPLIANCGISSPKSTLIRDWFGLWEKKLNQNMIVKRDDFLTIINGTVVSNVKIELTHVKNISENMKIAKNFRDVVRIFRDKRTILNDPSMIPGSNIYELWNQVYSSYAEYVPEYIPIRKNFRMIAEVRLPIDEKILNDNIDFYVKQGYDSVLLTFDGSENPEELLMLALKCKNAGLSVWFAFGGKEDLKQSVFIAPASLKRLIEKLAPISDGMLLGWRRTSLHLFIPDKEFTNFIIKSARDKNPKILIIGESYLGETAESQDSTYVTTNVPTNSSACLLVNIGYSMVSSKILDVIFGNIKVPKAVLVIGDKPYYQSKSLNKFDFLKNLKIKQSIEKKFRTAGAIGTITIHGDGSNGIYNMNMTDNIAHSGR